MPGSTRSISYTNGMDRKMLNKMSSTIKHDKESTLQEALSTFQQSEKRNKRAEGDLGFKTTETILADSYLPALRSFQTTQRPVKKS